MIAKELDTTVDTLCEINKTTSVKTYSDLIKIIMTLLELPFVVLNEGEYVSDDDFMRGCPPEPVKEIIFNNYKIQRFFI